MKRLVLAIALFLLVFSAKAQEICKYYTVEKDGSIELDITNYDFYERFYTIYNIYKDARFEISEGRAYGLFRISTSEDFGNYLSELHTGFSELSKYDLTDYVEIGKETLPGIYVTSMLFDIALENDRATTVNDHCANSDPFCTSEIIQFDAPANTSQEDIPDAGCLNSRPCPAWFHMRINTSGKFIIHMEGLDPNNGTQRDIDFCIWGPFDDPTTPCTSQLTSDKIIDCCYSASYSENAYLGYQPGEHTHQTGHGNVNYHLPETGEYYILLITNFSQQDCRISFTKQENSGPGTTDCSIIDPFLTANTPCVGSSLVLQADDIQGASYTWTGPDNQTHNGRVWTRNNATMAMAGVYTCHVVSGQQSGNETLHVEVLPNVHSDFTFGSAIAGQAVQFTGTETTTPSGNNNMITEREWNFGDGTTSQQANPTHTYSNANTYTVTYTVRATGGDDGVCEDTKTKTVTVTNQYGAVASCTNENICDGETTSVSVTATGGFGNYTYSWSPAQYVDYPNAATTTVHPPVGTTTFTCTTSDGTNTTSPTVAIHVHEIPNANAGEDQSITFNNSATLTAATVSGASYAWAPADKINGNANQQTVHTKQLTDMQTFTLTVTSQYGCTDTDDVTVFVGNQLQGTATVTGPSSICEGEETVVKANPVGGTGSYTYSWSPAQYVDNPNSQITTVHPNASANQFTCTVNDGESTVNLQTTVTVNPIPEAVASCSYVNILAGNYVLLTAQPVDDATCSWEPANLINNIIDPWTAKTINLPENENTTFTLTVTTSSGCTSQDELVVKVYKSLDEGTITTDNTVVCEDHNVTLTANPDGGTGNYTYYWSPEAYVDDPYAQTVTARPNMNNHVFTCMIKDEGIDDLSNNKIYKDIDIEVLEKPNISTDLIGRSRVEPGIGIIPYIYEYNIDVLNLNGYGIDDPETQFIWTLNTWGDVPNHVPGTNDQSKWILQEDGGYTAYVMVNEQGYALLRCTIITSCGHTHTQKFIYTDDQYLPYQYTDEIDVENMIDIYPNPSNGEINIQFAGRQSSESVIISVYSYNGIMADRFEVSLSEGTIPYSMNGFANGLYFINITGKDFTVTKKIIINR